MDKTQHIDSTLLENYIEKSGLKIGFIVNKLGISRQSFDMKRKGNTPFRASEVYVICDLLKISENDKSKIFCPKG